MSDTDRPRIGCAGWAIPAAHAALFGEGDSHLARYATRFDVVEVNSTFRRTHLTRTFERWAASVPGDFLFSVKLPEEITHAARLQGVGAALDRFFAGADGLGDKLGGVLVQLPPSLAFDARVADRFLAMLRRRCQARIAVEPRHASWFLAGVDALWERYRVARVAADPAREPAAAVPGGSARSRWEYWRWHGSPRMYYSAYDDDALRRLAGQLHAGARGTRRPWCIFDNTAAGHAMADAARLQEMLLETRASGAGSAPSCGQ